MSLLEIIGLALVAAAGGAINAVAGGGTILIFPTLLAFGTPAIAANATTTLSLVLGTGGSIYGYRRQMGPVRLWLSRFMPVSIAGSLLGSWLLTVTSEKTFSRLVPFLILFATVLFVAQGVFKRFAMASTLDTPNHHPPRAVTGAIIFQFLVAVYGGYFGAGIGILMLASLGFIGLHDIHEMNALKSVLAGLINLAAAIWFVCAGLIYWPQAGVMTIGAFAGYFLGSHYSQRIPQASVRRLITTIGFALSALTFYKEFLS